MGFRFLNFCVHLFLRSMCVYTLFTCIDIHVACAVCVECVCVFVYLAFPVEVNDN